MEPELSKIEPDDREALFALLRAVCDEVYSLGCDIISLGDALTADLEVIETKNRMRELQSFDLFGQRAIAQARLLQGLERMLSNYESASTGRVSLLIQALPFHAERSRLADAFRGQRLAECSSERDDSSDPVLF